MWKERGEFSGSEEPVNTHYKAHACKCEHCCPLRGSQPPPGEGEPLPRLPLWKSNRPIGEQPSDYTGEVYCPGDCHLDFWNDPRCLSEETVPRPILPSHKEIWVLLFLLPLYCVNVCVILSSPCCHFVLLHTSEHLIRSCSLIKCSFFLHPMWIWKDPHGQDCFISLTLYINVREKNANDSTKEEAFIFFLLARHWTFL